MNKEILGMPHVLFTPHNAFNTIEAEQRIVEMTMKNIQSYLGGGAINTVKPIE